MLPLGCAGIGLSIKGFLDNGLAGGSSKGEAGEAGEAARLRKGLLEPKFRLRLIDCWSLGWPANGDQSA